MRAFVLILAMVAAGAAAEELPPFEHVGKAVALGDDPYREFDFWLGTWDVANKHLREGGWVDSGSAEARIERVAGGNAVLERWTGKLGGNPLIGFSVRAWDPELGKWSVWLNWHGGRPGGFSPMHGTRRGERIELLPPGGETPRYSFSQAHGGSCQWDQATLKDGTWTTDWVMQFRRSAEGRTADAASAEVEMPPESAAAFEQTRHADFLLGRWKGADGTTATVTSMIEGFALLIFVDGPDGERTLAALGHDARAGGWVGLSASSARPGIERAAVEIDGGTLTFGDTRWSCEAERCTLTRGDRRSRLERVN